MYTTKGNTIVLPKIYFSITKLHFKVPEKMIMYQNVIIIIWVLNSNLNN